MFLTPQASQEIADQLAEKNQKELSEALAKKLSEAWAENQKLNRKIEALTRQVENQELKELTRQAVTTAYQGAGQPANQKRLLAQLNAADVSEAVSILRGMEQHDLAHAAQRAREQGALLLWSDAEGAYRAFERAHEYEPQDLSTLWWLVDLAQRRGSLNDAQCWATTAFQITKEKAARDPSNSDWQRDLSVSYNKVAGILEAQGERKQAQAHYEKSLAISEKLAARDPSNSDWQRDLSVSYNNVAGILQAQGERKQAQAHYEKSLAISEKLAARDPSNAQWQADLAVSYVKLAGVEQRGAQVAWLNKALDVLKALEAKDALTADQKGWIPLIEDAKKAAIAGAPDERNP